MKKILLAIFAVLALVNIAFAAVNLNNASLEELDSVKGIGTAKAQAIIDYRQKNGPFRSVDDLKNVHGFGDKSVAKMRSELSVSGATSVPAVKDTKQADKPAKSDIKPHDKGIKSEEKPSEHKAEAHADKHEQAAKPEAGDKKEQVKDAKADKKAAKEAKKAGRAANKEAKKAAKADKQEAAKSDKK
jgi:competence protein ComEA